MVGEIQPDALLDRLENGDRPLVVDIRRPEDFDESHLPDSRNVPLAEIPGQIDEIAKNDHVVTVCPHGKASVKAARIVEAYQDFEGTVDSLAGGLEAWDGPLDMSDADDADYEEDTNAPF